MTNPVLQTRNIVSRSGFANPITLDLTAEEEDDIQVYADDELLSPGTDYIIDDLDTVSVTIIGADDPDEYVGYTTFTLVYDPELSQNNDLSGGGQFGVAFEEALDLQNKKLQSLADRLDRALTVPPYVEGPVTTETPVDGQVPVWDEAEGRFTWAETPAQSEAFAIAAEAAQAAAELAQSEAESAATAAGGAQTAAETAQAGAETAQGLAEAAQAAAEAIVSGFSAFWLSVVSATSAAASWLLLLVLGHLTTRTAIKALVPSAGMAVYLSESGREGTFIWRTGDYSTQIAADTAEGVYLKADTIASTAGAWVRGGTAPLNVKWFGAVGDGTTDDALAIQIAINLAATVLETSSPYTRTSGEVYVPTGDYAIASGSTIRLKKGVKLKGAGRAATWFTHGGGSVPAFDVDTGASLNDEIELSDFTLVGAGATTTYGFYFYISIRSCALRNINISNCNYNVYLEDCWTFLIERCNIRNAIVDNVWWKNATAGAILYSRLDFAGRNNLTIDKAGSNNTVLLSLTGSYLQFAAWYGLNIISAVEVSIFGGYFEGNNTADGSRSDILWSSASNEGYVLSIFGAWFSSSSGGASTNRAIITNGRILNMYGCRVYNGGGGYAFGVVASGNALVVNLHGCSIDPSHSIGAGVYLNDGGKTDGSTVLNKIASGAASALTIAAGVITVTKSTHRVDTQSAAATDDLDTINGGVDGMLLTLRTVDSGRDVVVKHNTGNIKLGAGADVTLSTNIRSITLIYCADLSFWVQLAAI